MKHKHDKIVIPAHDAPHQPPFCHGECGGTETGKPIPAVLVSGERIGKSVEIWHIPGMDCPIEEKEIRQALSGIEGIHALFFRLSSRSLEIDATDEAREKALKAIGEAGFGVTPAGAEKAGHDYPSASGYRKAGIALVIALGVEFLHVFAPQTLLFEILVLSLALSAILLSGLPVYISGLRALLHGRLNISALMAVAVTGACILGQWAEAAMVMVLYAIAELIEARSVDRARNAIRALLSLAPETAECRLPDGHWETVHVRRVMPGQVIRTKPGERIPLDGRIVSGYSAVNQMPITGESLLTEKMPEDIVYAGSINETGLLEIKVTALADDTLLARIIATVEEAQEARAPTQRFIDRFAAVYVPAIFLVASAVAVLMPLAAGWTWHDAIYRALVLLVIACPCALVIATPITVVSGLTAAARVGILIKGGIYLEKAHKLKVVALDKTGTVTEGRPRLVSVEYMQKADSQSRILCWAATLAFRSAHPVSRAIYEGISDDSRPGEAENFIEMPGKGSQAVIEGKKRMLGNVRWIREQGLDVSGLQEQLVRHEKSGYTVTLLASEEGVLALFAVADSVRSNSIEAVEELICRKITPVMLTGDNALTAEIIASQVGIMDVRSNLLPEDKLAAIEDLRAKYKHVAMVGDGINDAPALAVADIGIAMGGAGTDMAMETADVVIMNDDPRRVIDLVRLSRRTFRLLRQNIVIALGIKLLFLILALAGYASMWMAVFADVGATLIVVFNGLRLLRWRSRFVRHQA